MACEAGGIECYLERATFWQWNCEDVHSKKTITLATQATRSDKMNADLINDTLLNTSTHFQILFIKKRKRSSRSQSLQDLQLYFPFIELFPASS